MQAALLDADVTDDGLPLSVPGDPGSGPVGISCSWSKIGGPGDVSFADPNVAGTTAVFSAPGDYTLRVTASDGSIQSHDDLAVHVAKHADLDKDDDTDVADLILFFNRWLDTDCNNLNSCCFGADQAGKGQVDADSFAVMSLNWPGINVEVPDPDLSGYAIKMVADTGVTYDAFDKVSQWVDNAPASDFVQATAGKQPTFVADAINGLPAIVFDGSGQHLDIADDPLINTGAGSFVAKTITIVFKTSADITSRQVLWEQGGNSNGLNFYIDAGKIYINAFTSDWGPTAVNASAAANTAYVATLSLDAGSTVFEGFLNGSSVGTYSPISSLNQHSGDGALGHTETKSKFHDGNTTDAAPLNGSIAEFHYFNIVLSPADRQSLEDYLMSKYAIGS
jgi:hypothetical protein